MRGFEATSRTKKLSMILFVFFLFCTDRAIAQIDVMFSDGFENLNAGDTPDQFLPTLL
ncbi:unnamed protein product [marine sediment metagenome]|uniref:Uncharacterized protein n=1 Tax=marine sediment metagenome TaxID=412755 RepID=X1GQB3_9ZZZZ